MTPERQTVLFENTACDIAAADRHIKERHVANCAKADLRYDAGVAEAIGLIVSEAAQ